MLYQTIRSFAIFISFQFKDRGSAHMAKLSLRLMFGIASYSLLQSANSWSAGLQVGFQSGTVIQFDGTEVALTDGDNQQVENVLKFAKGGFFTEMILVDGASKTETTVGNYSGAEGVLHSHWAELGGAVEQVRMRAASGASFDLNYFKITSNTENGGGQSTGNEDTYIIASVDGTTESYRYKLPSVNWGAGDGDKEIYLGDEFDGIKAFWFDSEGNTFCFGLDKFYVNLAPPQPDDPNTATVVGTGTINDIISDPVSDTDLGDAEGNIDDLSSLDAASFASSAPATPATPVTPVPALPLFGLLTLGGLVGLFGLRKLKK